MGGFQGSISDNTTNVRGKGSSFQYMKPMLAQHLSILGRQCEQSFLSQCATPRTSVWEANGAFQKSELAGDTGHFENEILVFKGLQFPDS